MWVQQDLHSTEFMYSLVGLMVLCNPQVSVPRSLFIWWESVDLELSVRCWYVTKSEQGIKTQDVAHHRRTAQALDKIRSRVRSRLIMRLCLPTWQRFALAFVFSCSSDCWQFYWLKYYCCVLFAVLHIHTYYLIGWRHPTFEIWGL